VKKADGLFKMVGGIFETPSRDRQQPAALHLSGRLQVDGAGAPRIGCRLGEHRLGADEVAARLQQLRPLGPEKQRGQRALRAAQPHARHRLVAPGERFGTAAALPLDLGKGAQDLRLGMLIAIR
jgi:hypothetical protein